MGPPRKGTLGFVELEMKAAGLSDYGVSLENPNSAAIATGAGIFARRAEDPAYAVCAVLAHPAPGLLDVVTAKQELPMPPKIGGEQVRGFSLWLAKAVLNGRGSEFIDLAKTNLLR